MVSRRFCMYLIVFDSNCVKQNREYYLCKGDYLQNVFKFFPEIKDIKKDNIEEILICSLKNEDINFSAKICQCNQFYIDDNQIKIIYENIESLPESCEHIRTRIFSYLYKQEIKKKNELPPFIVLIKDYQTYIEIKENTNEVKYNAFMDVIIDLKARHKWKEIVDKFPNEQNIEKHEFWNNAYCLNELTYALSKIIEPGYKKLDVYEKEKLQQYFFKVVNRCIDLEPNNCVHKSILAYHYYVVFMAEHNNKKEYYEKAESLYTKLIVNSNEKFKELYRYTKLRELNFELIKWQGGDQWVKKVNEIVNDYSKLISDYDLLSDDKQKKYKKEYIGALFGYSKFNLENLLKYYDAYVDNNIFGKPIKEFLFKKERLESIPKIESYLNKIIELRGYNQDNKNIDLRVKPSYFDIYYRLSQVEQIKGLVYVLKGEKEEKYIDFFKTSNEYVNKVLNLAKERAGKEKFLFPDFIKLIKAINLHFLKQYNDCHKNFFRAKNYMIYEQGVLYYLQNEKEHSLEVLKTIPNKDTCYNKAQTLIKRIKDEI